MGDFDPFCLAPESQTRMSSANSWDVDPNSLLFAIPGVTRELNFFNVNQV